MNTYICISLLPYSYVCSCVYLCKHRRFSWTRPRQSWRGSRTRRRPQGQNRKAALMQLNWPATSKVMKRWYVCLFLSLSLSLSLSPTLSSTHRHTHFNYVYTPMIHTYFYSSSIHGLVVHRHSISLSCYSCPIRDMCDLFIDPWAAQVPRSRA